jgi:hypothetical protein
MVIEMVQVSPGVFAPASTDTQGQKAKHLNEWLYRIQSIK